MSSMGNGKNGKESNLFLHLVRSSIILTFLDKITAHIYKFLKTGLFGYIFTGYKPDGKSRIAENLRNSKAASHFTEFRYGMCRRIETSVVINYFAVFMKYLLGCRLKAYGAFLASFGAYTAVAALIGSAIRGTLSSLAENVNVALSIVMVLSSLAFVMSKKTLAEALLSSYTGRLLIKVTGFCEEDLKSIKGNGGHMNTAFLLGIICGALTYFVSPIMIIAVIAGCVWAYLVLVRPEVGVVTMFFTMPIFPTMFLAAIVAYTTVCYVAKLFRGKRKFRLEPVDIMVMAFTVLLFFGGTISLSETSLKPALLMVCLILGYFLTVQLMNSREWLVRCSSSCIIAASLISLYGLYLYFTGGGYSSGAWVDDEMFSAINTRAVSTLENPNMLGEYLILIIPIAVANFIGRGEGLRRFEAFFCIGVMGVCLILTWSRGAWLGLIFGILLFLFMWHRRSLWLIFAGIASLPILPSILPASIVSRFTSIGNLSDSSTSYRMYIWRASVEMIEDNALTGIGIGEGAWDRMYPMYSYLGVEAAPHSHNLFIQIWLELGIFGILAFVAFIFLLYQAAFTLFAKLSDKGTRLKTADISESVLEKNIISQIEDKNIEMEKGKTQLRISSAGPLCGIFAVLVQGMTDYTWYNYRVYLMFWLVCGLAAAYVRCGRDLLENPADYTVYDKVKCETEITLVQNNKDKNSPRCQSDE